MKIKIGPKLDLCKVGGNYRFIDYYNQFIQDYETNPEVIEFHLLLDNVKKTLHLRHTEYRH